MGESPSPPSMMTDEESPCSSPSRVLAEKGELYISLRYQSKSGRINVVVLKGENIQRGKVLQSGKKNLLMSGRQIPPLHNFKHSVTLVNSVSTPLSTFSVGRNQVPEKTPRLSKAGFSLANIFARSDFFPPSLSFRLKPSGTNKA